MARLDVMEDTNVVKSFAIEEEVIIGRSVLEQDTPYFLHLPDTRISRKHARITRLGWTFLLEDLGSINGTILRGDLIASNTPCDLYDGDDIWLASYHLTFHAEEDKLTLQSDLEPALLPADAAQPDSVAEPTPEPVTVILRGDDVMHSQLSAILDASAIMRLPNLLVPRDHAANQEALRRLHAMCQVSAVLGILQDGDLALQKVLDIVFDIFPEIDRAFILLGNDASHTLRPAAAKTRHTAARAEDFAVSQPIVTEVLTHKRAIRSLDTLSAAPAPTPNTTGRTPSRHVMCVPLLVSDTEVFGLIQVETASSLHVLTDQDLEVLTGIAAQAAMAMKNAQLYATAQQETTRRTSLQRSFPPAQVEKFLSESGPSALAGQAYRGPLLCADLLGLTAMSETMPPSAVMARLQQYFAVMHHLIYNHNGNVDQCAGDTLLAFWSVPQRGEEEESEAVRTALDMQGKLWALNVQWEAAGQLPLYMGVGMHMGDFIAGNIGSEDNIAFTLIGENVHLTAQLVKLAARYQVLVSEAIWQPLQQVVGAIRLLPRRVCGQSTPIPLYSIRSMQHRSRSTCLLAWPCTLLDHQGAAAGHGMLTEGAVGKPLRLVLSTSRDVQIGEVLTLQPEAPEYHAAPQCVARVESCARRAYDGQKVYTKAILTVLEEEGLTALLTPGSCVMSARTWDTWVRQ